MQSLQISDEPDDADDDPFTEKLMSFEVTSLAANMCFRDKKDNLLQNTTYTGSPSLMLYLLQVV